ncbi:unnamed protein product [Didymodactylos carnosus]|nr:unnamed protein product [Didymodactylos carnosus]CAF4180499.1 unnamed protein product [Didymodactylos carnosus]
MATKMTVIMIDNKILGFLLIPIQNTNFRQSILFDLWWIDTDDHLHIVIQTTEIYVYLCKKDRWSKEVDGIKIFSFPPAHLPPQHTVILKWVSLSCTTDDIESELKIKFESIYSVEDMNGTKNDKTRHVKVEILSECEYNSLLNSGKINLHGHLYDVYEFLPPPKVLMCNRCNKPGHTKKSCRNSISDKMAEKPC